MVDHKLSRWLLAAVLAPLACGPGPYDDHPGDSRFLDGACSSGACTTKGAAERVSGPTSDTMAFLLDGAAGSPSGAAVTIPLDRATIPPEDNVCNVEILVSGRGSFAVATGLGSFDAPREFAWVRVTSDCRSPLVVSVKNDSTLLIDDVRVVTTKSRPGCGLANAQT
jgi:hypothetical protein